MVSGSAASGVHGHVRTTRDIDVVVRITRDDIDALVEAFHADFYVDPDLIRSAIEWRRSFNVIHFRSSFKFDLFPLTDDRFHQTEFGRHRFVTTSMFGTEPVEFAVATPEDVILSKLSRYRKGHGVGEQQWNDVLGVIAVQAEKLDLAYMREWAAYLKVSDLLEQALQERHEAMP